MPNPAMSARIGISHTPSVKPRVGRLRQNTLAVTRDKVGLDLVRRLALLQFLADATAHLHRDFGVRVVGATVSPVQTGQRNCLPIARTWSSSASARAVRGQHSGDECEEEQEE